MTPASVVHRVLIPVAFALAASATLPAALPAPDSLPPAPPLRVGVGGDYPNGLDGQLSARGYPWERIFPWEMSKPEVLGKFDVILLSCVPETLSGVDTALANWMKAGGHAYVETWTAQNRFPLQSLVNIYTNAPTLGDVVLTDPAHPIAAGLDPAKPFDMHHLQGLCAWPRQRDAGAIVARYCLDKGTAPIERAPAIIDLPVGEGRLVYSGAPVSFARFHRGRSPEGLLVGLINYLLPNGPAPRLLYTEPANTAPPGDGPRLVLPPSEEEEAEEQPPPEPEPPPPLTPEVGTPPAGFELLGSLAAESYDVLAQLSPAAGNGEAPTLVALDARYDAAGKLRQPCLWLTITPQRLEVRSGKEPRGKPLAAADCTVPTEGVPLHILRRQGELSIILGATQVVQVRTKSPLGGGVALRPGATALNEPTCQPVAPAVFDDSFMREADSPTPWTPVSGIWKNLGVGNEEYSINGFYYLGRGDQSGALATAGDWFWEDYSLTAAVQTSAAAIEVGLCALVQKSGDYVALTADASKARLVRHLSGSDSVLAEADGGLIPKQWYRLGLRLSSGTLEATLDGRPVLSCANPEYRPGIVGLLARNGSARFDDVVVRPSDEAPRPWGDEGSPHAVLPPSLGAHDMVTWGSPATPWEADPERPSLLWHDGLYPGDFDVTLKVEPVSEPALRRFILAPSYSSPESERLAITLSLLPDSASLEAGGAPRKSLPFGTVPQTPPTRRGLRGLCPVDVASPNGSSLPAVPTLRLSRRFGRLTAFWNEEPVLRLDKADAPRRTGLEVFGPPVGAKDLAARSLTAHDYVFGVAPTDWWVSAGEWQVSARWACDDRWSWLAGWASGDAAIWHKRRFDGDLAVDCWMGTKMNAPGGSETVRCRDYNMVICGDRENPRSGYSLIIGGDSGVKTQLLRNGQVVAESPDIRVPAGYNVHHCWFRVRMSRIGNVVSCDFERRPVFRYEDPDPLPGGYVGLWTKNSGILVPRVTIWGSGG
ncbi:MAG: hypothetical protein FJX75_21355 [Armatimonadetes bacterium]|nr:hypothetical protein [Armatimonadota bacterium]